MTEKHISCPACRSDNLENSVYCCQCGLPMREGIPVRHRKNQWLPIILISLVLSILMTFALQQYNSHYHGEPVDEKLQEPDSKDRTQAEIPRNDHAEELYAPPASPLARDDKNQSAINQLIVGQVSIISRHGNRIAQIPMAVVNGSWLALPSRFCIGGDKWLFKTNTEVEIAISGGLWHWSNAAGLWQLAGKDGFPGPALATWQQELPVRLLIYESGRLTEKMMLTPERQDGYFLYCPLSKPMSPGIFLQNGKVVGWCFGDIFTGAYMWSPSSSLDLHPEITVKDFYNETFAGGREDFFSRALAAGGETPPELQLQMFTEAFWYPLKLSDRDTPQHLRPEILYPFIVQLADYLMDRKQFGDIVRLADEPLLWEIRSPKLLIDVSSAVQKTYGAEAAVNFLEGPGADIIQSIETDSPDLNKLHANLYLTWLNNLLENGDTVKGWQIYTRARDRFPDSAAIHLAGVELALADSDWMEAESLLYRKKYPEEFREKMLLLANRISEIKGKENQIIINFQPGSQEIPVTATIDALIDQDFLIDTGSSYVTIPHSAIQSLGLENRISEQQQEIHTASGTVYANFIILPSIELQGWVVNDVRALILDLPNRPGIGLLGMNYLDRFRMDLKPDSGTLVLEPR